jgi:amidase
MFSTSMLAGVPIGVKASEGRESVQTRRLLAAGCLPIGATSVPTPATAWQTWGYTDCGPTRHSYHPSGRPAARQQARRQRWPPASCRWPLAATAPDRCLLAAWCGILGLRLTTGLLPARDRAGLNTGGPLARHATDVTAYLTAVAGHRGHSAAPMTARPIV